MGITWILFLLREFGVIQLLSFSRAANLKQLVTDGVRKGSYLSVYLSRSTTFEESPVRAVPLDMLWAC